MTRAKSKPSIPNRAPEKMTRPSAKVAGSPAQKAPIKLAALPRPARAALSGAQTELPPPRKRVLNKPLLGTVAASVQRAPATPSAPTRPTKVSQTRAAPRSVKRDAAALKTTLIDTPAKIRPIEQAVGVSSDAVARRTGKSWAQWFALLDAAGAAELDHKGIVAVLAQRHGVGPWWQQMVTVAYEQARGRREKPAADDGFQVDVSKTLELPLAKLFRFWAEPAERNKWLADDRFAIHKATASKSIRARWGRGVSRIDVDFYDKGAGKSQVTVQHNRIETSDAAEQMKAYWAKKIRALEALLTGAEP
jgi:hypothetical protein